MPAPSSNFSRYVIPSELDPEGICCISVPVPDDPQWRAMFFGALWRLSLQSHYERDAAHSGKIVAAKWREIWMEVINMGCCNDDPSQININISAKQVQNFMLALEWQKIWNGGTQTVSIDYYNIPDTYSTDAGDAGDELEWREQALCLAVQGWLNEVMNYMESWLIANVDEVGTVGGGLIVAAAAVSGLVMWPVIIGLSAVGAIGVGIFTELRSTAYREYLICRMYENLRGKNPDLRSDFDASLTADLVGRPQPETPGQDISRDLIEQYLRSQLNNLDNYLMFAGQLGTSFDIASSGQLTAQDCDCLAICENYNDGLDLALGPNTHLQPDPSIPVPPGPNGDGGVWNALAGETLGGILSTLEGFECVPGGECITIATYIQVPAGCTITRVQYRVKYSEAGSNRGHALEFFDAFGTLVHSQYNELHGVSGAWGTSGAVGMSVVGARWIKIFDQSHTLVDSQINQDSIAVDMS